MSLAAHLAYLFRACARGAACFAACLVLLTAAQASNPIQIENAKPGTTDWRVGNYALDHEIEGYASATSVARGGQISLFVNTSSSTYTLEVFRMGWYGGTGARRITDPVQLPGVQQPAPTTDPVTGLIECAWTNPYVLSIPSNPADPTDWASGVYLVKLTATDSGKSRFIIFVVRDDARTSAYLFMSNPMTYQAYNDWGGKSLYAFNSTGGQARKVSFNRPYEEGDTGAGQFLGGWEYQMVRFLEREGYDVTYVTDVDVHENPNLLPAYKALLVVGHPEYWTWQMRSNVVAARDQGVSLGFFAADACYWQVRFETSPISGVADRTVVGYKEFAYPEDPYFLDSDPSNDYLVTVRWREYPLNNPEDAFIGVMYDSSPVHGDIVLADASNWAFATTGLHNGDSLPGLLGYEVDREFTHTPPGTVLLAHSPYPFSGTTQYSDMTVYTAASGATVFATGSMQWNWGLDDFAVPLLDNGQSRLNPAAQQVTRNVLARFLSDQPPLADPGGPYTGEATLAVQFSGNGSSDADGVVTTYEWDFGDGATRTGVMPTHAYDSAGTYTVTLVVTDDKGGRNAATTTATITAATPAVSLSSSSLVFALRLVGTTSAAQDVTLTNPGGASLTITSIVASGDFARTTTCGASLAAGGSCTISVTFTPTATGARSGSIDITDNAFGSPHQVSLSGTGTDSAASLSPTSLSFGTETSQPVGTTSAPQTVTLTNVGNTTFSIGSITVSGDFNRTTSCGTSLVAGATCTISVTFSPTAGGTRTGAVTITDGAAGSPHAVDLTGFATVAPPTAVSVTPNSGIGASQTFSFLFSDVAGANKITYVQALINGSFAWYHSCSVLYYQSTNRMYLVQDSGTGWQGPLTPGQAGTLSNSQCTLNGGASSVSAVGNNLTVNAALSFKQAFTGNKTVFLDAEDVPNSLRSGFQALGNWTVPTIGPTAVSVTPNSGSGTSQTFSFFFSDAGGANKITYVQALINGSFSWYHACAVLYLQTSNRLYLVLDSGTGWQGPLTPGQAGTLSNSQCTLDGGASSVSAVGNNLTVNAALTFKPAFGGNRTVYMDAEDIPDNLSSGFQTRGSWAVPASPPTAVSVAPNSGWGTTQTFSFLFSDDAGANKLTYVQALINGSFAWYHSCSVLYYQSTNRMYLVQDSGTGWQGPLTPGQAGTLSNSQCTLNGGASSVSAVGNNLTVNAALSFKPAFTGGKTVFLDAEDTTNKLSSGWQTLGSWTVPSPPTAVSVTPNSGSGATQTFSFLFSDGGGANKITYIQALINGSFSWQNACAVLYYQSTNRLYLVLDSGTGWQGPLTPGQAGTLQNSQCTLDGGGSSVSGLGNNLTVNAALTFKPAFTGNKTVYLDAEDVPNSLSSGFQALGSWTVP